MRNSFHDLRKEFGSNKLDIKEVSKDPFIQLSKWLEDSISAQIPEPNAMILSTSDNIGKVSSRVVLLKTLNKEGIVFFTNYHSRKAVYLSQNQNASLLFFWPALERQISIEGAAQKISEQDSDNYFKERPRESQIGAWASAQSKIITDRSDLEKEYEIIYKKYEGQIIPRPPFWGGYIVKPEYFEFWQGRENRLHDRICYQKEAGIWVLNRLAP
jgi:pyridoxamine 5'-phosphate oxidase